MTISILKHEKILWITRTAVLIALTVVLQFITIQFAAGLGPGAQFVTGSVVNFMLIISVMTCGLPTGLTVSIFTPILPTLLGFGPMWPIVPFIAAGNMALVTAWHFIGNRDILNTYIAYCAALIVGAAAKFLVLYIGVVQIAIPYILGLPVDSPPAILMSFMFSWPQLITAAAGGICAIIILPALLKAIKQRRQ